MKEKETMERARWIWCNDTPAADEYGEFYTDFVWQGGKALFFIQFFAFGQHVRSPPNRFAPHPLHFSRQWGVVVSP